MESVIKSFLGVFFIILITAIGVSLMSTAVYSRKMNSFASDTEYRIENSHFADGVIESTKKDAENLGCTLSVEKDVSSGDGRAYGRMVIEYPYVIKLLGIKKTKRIERDLV